MARDDSARCAIVTGTSRGLGQAVARALLDDGWRVFGLARSDPKTAFPDPTYTHVTLDLRDLDALNTWLEHDESLRLALADCTWFGLVNNAGVLAPIAPTPRLRPHELVQSFLVNTIAPVLLGAFVVRSAADFPARVVNVSTGAAGTPYPGWSAYCSSKAALAMAGRVLAAELEEIPWLTARDLAVVSYAPGVVDTRMQEEIRRASEADFPRKATFEQFAADGRLVSADGPAREIAELLGSTDLPRYEERRFGGAD